MCPWDGFFTLSSGDGNDSAGVTLPRLPAGLPILLNSPCIHPDLFWGVGALRGACCTVSFCLSHSPLIPSRKLWVSFSVCRPPSLGLISALSGCCFVCGPPPDSHDPSFLAPSFCHHTLPFCFVFLCRVSFPGLPCVGFFFQLRGLRRRAGTTLCQARLPAPAANSGRGSLPERAAADWLPPLSPTGALHVLCSCATWAGPAPCVEGHATRSSFPRPTIVRPEHQALPSRRGGGCLEYSGA